MKTNLKQFVNMSDEFEFDTFRVNKQLCEFSGNGKFLALAYQKTLTIRNVSNYSVFHSFVFSDTIEVSFYSNVYILHFVQNNFQS